MSTAGLDRAASRRQLAEMRSRLLGKLDRQIEGGVLALVGTVHTAIAALDAEAGCPIDAEPMARAIVTDFPGEQITLSLYAEDARAAVVELPPLRALQLAEELIAAAARRLR